MGMKGGKMNIDSIKLKETSPLNKFVMGRLNQYFRMIDSHIFKQN